jgi:hypothetical protein
LSLDNDAVAAAAASVAASAIAIAAIGEFFPSATAARPNSANLRCSRSEKLLELLVGRSLLLVVVVVVVVEVVAEVLVPKGGTGIVD